MNSGPEFASSIQCETHPFCGKVDQAANTAPWLHDRHFKASTSACVHLTGKSDTRVGHLLLAIRPS